MTKCIYIIRHCEAAGQSAEAPLTEKGFRQAEKLIKCLSDKPIGKIISSPYLRAIQSIKPFAEAADLEIKIDERLKERVLSTKSFPDWMDKLKATFDDMDLKYEGGESSNRAKQRIMEVIDEIIADEIENTIIVAHGGIISLLLHHYDKNFGFEQWQQMTNPDLFQLSISENEIRMKRIFESSSTNL